MTTDRFRIALALGLILLVAPASATDASLSIDVHRLALMMSQSRYYIGALTEPEVEARIPPPAFPSDFDTLAWAVGQYNFVEDRACRTGNLAPNLCLGAYAPPWLPMTDRRPDAARLRGMTSEAEARLRPLW